MSAPEDGPAYVPGADMHLGPPVRVPGKPWVDEAGVRRFICPGCGFQFRTDPRQSDDDRQAEAVENLGAPVPAEHRLSVCDDCYPVILERARAAGLIE